MEISGNFNFINTKYLYDVSDNEDFIKKILSLFKEQVTIFKKDLPKFLKQKNYTELGELVHKAKSGISILGMEEQAKELKTLETDIRNSENTETYVNRINKFLSDCEQAVSEIEILEKQHLNN